MLRKVITVIAILSLTVVYSQTPLQQTEKPWTYWWWMGSAIDKANITYQLQAFSRSGFGGVHIIPIYGVKGYANKFIPFMNRQWLSMLEYTIAEARKVSLGVDMTMGTGWPFGGPQIPPELSAKRYFIDDGHFSMMQTGQKVKRAAPGGEGLVMDHFNKTSVQRYLDSFDSSLNTVRHKLRGLYNDSYEVYGANWTDDFLSIFNRKRGYDLETHINDFLDTTGTDIGVRVRIDYHQTLAELLHDNFTDTWTAWSKKRSFSTRNQAHGSPGNLLDLYALADIPETESFGTSGFAIPGLRIDENYEVSRFGTPDPLAMKFASSAANLTSKKLVSSETATWLGDHFKVSLSQVKPQLDELFTSGINHVFYHGITYSPREENFPGWLFYASTNFGLQSHVWKHIDRLNQYVGRCQQVLQQSKSDNDFLLYFPIHDVWATKAKAEGGIHLLEVHHTERWLRSSAFGKLATSLKDNGFSFDYVSDSLLLGLKVKDRKILSGTSSYKAIVVPPVNFIPVRTLEVLNQLIQKGATIVFQDHLPDTCTGISPASGIAFQTQINAIKSGAKIFPSNTLRDELKQLGLTQEGFSSNGLQFIRKLLSDGNSVYFVSNLNKYFNRGWIPLSKPFGSCRRYDPLSDSNVPLATRKTETQSEIFLELAPGESCFLFPSKKQEAHNAPTAERSYVVSGIYSFRFNNGTPRITEESTFDKPASWTTLSDSAAYFYGSGTYTTTFTLPDSILNYKALTLDLGIVNEVATVTLNGKNIGTTWCIPFRLKIPSTLLQRNNTVQIEVNNLSANYMRLYDLKHPEWKKFYDINIVDIQYKPYNSANVTVMPSGLTGDIKLLYR